MNQTQRAIIDKLEDILDLNANNRTLGTILASATNVTTIKQLFELTDEQLLTSLREMYGE